MTDLLLAIIAVALVYLAINPLLDNWRHTSRYAAYRQAVFANGWFDPEINPDASGRSSQSLPGNDGST